MKIVLLCLVVVLMVLVVLMMLGQLFFRRFGWYRRFACTRMGWHSYPNFDPTGFDGASVHACCRWCGYKGMIDSQGNLF